MYLDFNRKLFKKSFDFQQFTSFLLIKQATIRQKTPRATDSASVARGVGKHFV